MGAIDAARRTAERYMVDRCLITSDPEGTADAQVDPETLELIEPDPDETTVYVGPCRVYRNNVQARMPADVAGVLEAANPYSLSIPWDAEVPEPGDHVLMTKSADPALRGKRFRIVGVVRGTFVASRDCAIELVERANG